MAIEEKLNSKEIESIKQYYDLTDKNLAEIKVINSNLLLECQTTKAELENDKYNREVQQQIFKNEITKGYSYVSKYTNDNPNTSEKYSDSCSMIYATDINGNKITISLHSVASISRDYTTENNELKLKNGKYKGLFVEMTDGSFYELVNNNLKFYSPEKKEELIHTSKAKLPNGELFYTTAGTIEPTLRYENVTVDFKEIIQKGATALTDKFIIENNGFHK